MRSASRKGFENADYVLPGVLVWVRGGEEGGEEGQCSNHGQRHSWRLLISSLPPLVLVTFAE